jgi:hypothetical protein
MDDDRCEKICVCQTIVNQRYIQSSDEDLRAKIKIFNQQNSSPSLQSFPASTSLEIMITDPTREENTESEVHTNCKHRW